MTAVDVRPETQPLVPGVIDCRVTPAELRKTAAMLRALPAPRKVLAGDRPVYDLAHRAWLAGLLPGGFRIHRACE